MPLRGHPFGASAARALLLRLIVLQELKNQSYENGKRAREGQETYGKHFKGNRLSDSSDTDKVNFRQDFTFPHSAEVRNTLFCPWYGRARPSQLRIHFSWPVNAATPLYVVYVGPKITKR